MFFPSVEQNRQRDFCVNRTFLFYPPLRYNVLAKEDFAMKDEFITRVGVWGQRHYNYLKNHFPTIINVMRMKGTLEQYLKDIDKDAKDMFNKLVKQLADSEGITEEMLGLVFEEHLPECTPLYDVPVKRGYLVVRKGGDINNEYIVGSIVNGIAKCMKVNWWFAIRDKCDKIARLQ